MGSTVSKQIACAAESCGSVCCRYPVVVELSGRVTKTFHTTGEIAVLQVLIFVTSLHVIESIMLTCHLEYIM